MASGITIRTLALAAAGAAGVMTASPALAAGKTCTVAAIQAASPADTTIVSAEVLAKPAAHCKVEGYVTTTNPGPNKVNFRLQLPTETFQNRYYMIGMGGSAGYVPTDSQIPGGNPLVKGFVVAGTDTGRQGHLLDWDFLGQDRAKAVDHIDRGAHVVAVATQKITKDFYGTDKLYRYFSGCSGGGRMATMAIQNHPDDFDGVLLGAPGGRGTGSILKFIHAYQQMIREPGSWVSPAKLAMVEKNVTAACDMTDGAKDDVIWDHRLCKFDVATLQCKGGDAPDCLTVPEVKSIKAILDGPRGHDGKLLAQPMPISNMSTWSGFLGPVPPPWSPEASFENMPKSAGAYVIASTMANVYLEPGYDVAKFNLKSKADVDAWFAGAERIGYGSPYSADLSGLAKTDNKVLMWNGRSDPCCGDLELEQYYLDAAKKLGETRAQFSNRAALYQIPGMGHCGGGNGPQDGPDVLLEELIAWVEKGEKPGPVVSHRGADRVKLLFASADGKQESGVVIPAPKGGSRDFLLCPYPQVSTYKGTGAVEDAANWSCTTPKPGDARQG